MSAPAHGTLIYDSANYDMKQLLRLSRFNVLIKSTHSSDWRDSKLSMNM